VSDGGRKTIFDEEQPMTEFTGFSSSELEKALRDAEQRTGRIRELDERISELVGEGEAADGDVWVSWTANGGIGEVQIDPEAMALSPEELADAVRTAVREALADLREQVRDVTAEVMGEDFRADPEEARRQLEQARQEFDSRMGQVMGELDRARRTLSQ
jgi:DNA-binding protein YbaB